MILQRSDDFVCILDFLLLADDLMFQGSQRRFSAPARTRIGIGINLPCLKIQIPLQQVDLRLDSLETLPFILKSVLRASLFGVGLAAVSIS